MKSLALGAVGRVLFGLPWGRLAVSLADRVRPAKAPGGGPGGKFQILIYHRVIPTADPLAMAPVLSADFDAQMALVRRHFRVVSLPALMGESAAGDVPPGSICVTFDDGYRDNHAHAFPILRKHGIPATIFLATDVIGTGRMLWYDRVLEALRRAPAGDLAVEGYPRSPLRLGSAEQRRDQGFPLLEWLKSLPIPERDRRIDTLWAFSASAASAASSADGAGKSGARGSDADRLMLDWDEVREMRAGGIDFGCHTRSHPILSRLEAPAIEAEIGGSRREIEARIGGKADLFAYPNGRLADYNQAAKDALGRLGFACALTTNPGVNRAGHDRFEILRRQPWESSVYEMGARMLLERIGG